MITSRLAPLPWLPLKVSLAVTEMLVKFFCLWRWKLIKYFLSERSLEDGANMTSVHCGGEKAIHVLRGDLLHCQGLHGFGWDAEDVGPRFAQILFQKLPRRESESGGRHRWLHNTQYTSRMSFNIHCSVGAMIDCKVSAITLQPFFHGAVVSTPF